MAAEGGGSETKLGSATFYTQSAVKSDDPRADDSVTVAYREKSNESSRKAEDKVNSDNADPEESETRLCGYLNKCGNIGFVKTAKQLWFVFSDDTCKLYYYRTPQDLLPLGEIDIKHASFSFNANNRPGLFEIRSDGKVHYLDAQGQNRMNFWLEELQKKRRQYNAHRKTISSEKISWTLKNRRKGSGLTGQSNSLPLQSDSLPSSSPESLSASTKTRYWSFLNLRTEIRDAVSNMRSQISTPNKGSPNLSPGSCGSGDEWMLVDSEADHAAPTMTTSEPLLVQTSPTATTSPGSKLGGKLATTFKAFKLNKRSASDSEQKKGIFQPGGNQTCFKCKALQEDKFSIQEDLKTAEEELNASREIIKLLQKELDVMRVSMETRKECEGKTDDERTQMLAQRDKHVVELEHSMVVLQEQKSLLAQQAKFDKSELETLQDQVSMLQDMLRAKDETVVQLTHQIFELENHSATAAPVAKVAAGKEAVEDQRKSAVQSLPPTEPALLMNSARELEVLKDSVQAYQKQNYFLSKEITELNELRQMDEKREKELLMRNAELEALHCQIKSKYLFLLSEKQEPVRGGEESKSQEAVVQLLQEAQSELEEESDVVHPFLSSHSTEYDRYGFLKHNEEDEQDAVLVAKANQLQRQSDEISSRLKDVDEATSKHVKWENFMVGQIGKPLVRSPELKALIRMGIPHVHKEFIWKGCINFYVAETRDKLGPTYYKDLAEKIKHSGSNPAVKQIELDLLRTLPQNRHFDSLDSDGVPKLRRVLLSYSIHNPLIGYCQGLNRIAAIALLFLSEEESFWCLEALIKHIMPEDYFTMTLAAAQADQRVLKDLVAEKLPKLHSHLEQYEVDLSLYTFNWFLTIFVDNVRPEAFLRCWDALLYEGSKVLFRFALAFLKYTEEEILSQQEAPHIYRIMRSLGDKVTDIKRIVRIAFHEVNRLSMRTVTSKRIHHMQIVREELRKLDIIRQDFQSSYSAPSMQEGYVSDDDLDDIGEEEEEEEGEDGEGDVTDSLYPMSIT